MTSRGDLESKGFTCEVVATDWVRCVNKKTGEVWTCTNRGQDCFKGDPAKGAVHPFHRVIPVAINLYLIEDDSGGYTVTAPVARSATDLPEIAAESGSAQELTSLDSSTDDEDL